MLNQPYLTANTLKFPVLKSSFWFSALARPKPTVSTEELKSKSSQNKQNCPQRKSVKKMSKSDSQNCKDKIRVEIRFLLGKCVLKQHFLQFYKKGFWNKMLRKCFILYHILGDCITYEHISVLKVQLKKYLIFFPFSWFSVYAFDNY